MKRKKRRRNWKRGAVYLREIFENLSADFCGEPKI